MSDFVGFPSTSLENYYFLLQARGLFTRHLPDISSVFPRSLPEVSRRALAAASLVTDPSDLSPLAIEHLAGVGLPAGGRSSLELSEHSPEEHPLVLGVAPVLDRTASLAPVKPTAALAFVVGSPAR